MSYPNNSMLIGGRHSNMIFSDVDDYYRFCCFMNNRQRCHCDMSNSSAQVYISQQHYSPNAFIGNVRCYWRHAVSSMMTADLVSISIHYQGASGRVIYREVVPDFHSNGAPVTVQDVYNVMGRMRMARPEIYGALLAMEFVRGRSAVFRDGVCFCRFRL